MPATVYHTCGHTSQIDGFDLPEGDHEYVGIIEPTFPCTRCQSIHWISLLGLAQPFLTSSTGSEEDIETARLQRILILRDLYNRRDFIEREIFERLINGEFDRLTAQNYIELVASAVIIINTTFSQKTVADWWIEKSADIFVDIEAMTLDAFIEKLS